MECNLVKQGYKQGACFTIKNGKKLPACEVTLKYENNTYYRLIKSAHLSRPEHYLSIYQSGCNHNCLKCHSYEFSKYATGKFLSIKDIVELVKAYEKEVTVIEDVSRATMYHATDLCRSCGSCVIYKKKSELCPNVLSADKIVLSEQGFGPARNIIAFTGGDILCNVEFYATCSEAINSNTKNMFVLIETNGYGLTPPNLDRLKAAKVTSFWLDIKAYNSDIYKRLCGVDDNKTILSAPYEIIKRGFVLEVLTLFIPNLVEDEEIVNIAELICAIDKNIPFTILAFFPAYKMIRYHAPTVGDMIRVYKKVKECGLVNIKLGNCGVFIKRDEEFEFLLKEVGRDAIG